MPRLETQAGRSLGHGSGLCSKDTVSFSPSSRAGGVSQENCGILPSFQNAVGVNAGHSMTGDVSNRQTGSVTLPRSVSNSAEVSVACTAGPLRYAPIAVTASSALIVRSSAGPSGSVTAIVAGGVGADASVTLIPGFGSGSSSTIGRGLLSTGNAVQSRSGCVTLAVCGDTGGRCEDSVHPASTSTGTINQIVRTDHPQEISLSKWTCPGTARLS